MTRHAVPLLAAVALTSPRAVFAQAHEPAPLDLDDGEVIVITESRRERPLADTTVATEVITRAEIEASGAETVAELLEDHPGIDVVRSFRGSAIRMQGMDPDYVLVLVDGDRTIGRIGGALDLERFPVEDIERIEIVKGASSALYGSEALAGVVNIITRDADRPAQAEVHAAYGRFDTVDSSARLALRAAGLRSRTTAGWHRSDGYDLDGTTAATTASAHDELHVANRTSYQATPRLEIEALGDYLRRDQRGIDESATGAVFDRDTRTEVASASLRTRWRRDATHSLSGSGHYALWRDQFLSDQRGSDALDRYERSREQLLEARLQYDGALADHHFLTAGAEGLAELLESERLSADGTRTRLALFGQYEWTIASAPYLVAAPGVRADLDSQFGRHVSPKLAARWDPTPQWTVRASYGGGYRAPSFKELLLRFENPGVGYRVEGNPELEPETSRSANLGVEARPHRRTWAAVNLFHNDIDNLIATNLIDDGGAGGPQVFGYVNIASARTRGLEALVRLRLLTDLVAEFGYTLTDTLDRETGTALPGRALHRGTFELSYRVPAARLRASARGSVYGSRTFFEGSDASEPTTAPPYASIDGRVALDVTRRFTLFAGVDNVLDEGDPQLLPIAPRSFYGGITARY